MIVIGDNYCVALLSGWDISGYCRRRAVFLDVVVGHRLVGVFHVSSSAVSVSPCVLARRLW